TDVPQNLVGGVLALHKTGENVDVVRQVGVRRIEEQGRDTGIMPLTVTVDTPIALLNADQRPRDIEVDEVVTLRVQVHALGGDVAGDKNADRGILPLEAIDALH